MATSPSDAKAVIAASEGLAAHTEPDIANQYVSQLLGFYPAREVNDAKMYSAGMTALLAAYPVDLVKRVCDPVTGLPSRLKWLPTLADVREALDLELARRNRILWNANWVISEHAKRAAQKKEDDEFERNRPSVEERKRQADELLKSIRLNAIKDA